MDTPLTKAPAEPKTRPETPETDSTPAEGHEKDPSHSRALALSSVPKLGATEAKPAVGALPGKPAAKSFLGRWGWAIGLLVLLTGGALVASIAFGGLFASAPEGLLLHTVERGPLEFTIKQRGTLQSANNVDIICRVETGSRAAGGSVFIRWVIPDGSKVEVGDKLIELDSASLQEELMTQQITVDQAESTMITAREELEIVRSQGESDVALAEDTIILAALDLEKYCGLKHETITNLTLEELEALNLSEAEELPEKGEYRQKYDAAISARELAESNLKLQRDRVAYAQRMVKLGYMSPTKMEAEQASLKEMQAKLSEAERAVEVLSIFDRRKFITDYKSKVAEAMRALDRVKAQSKAANTKAEAGYRTAERIYRQELTKLQEVQRQIGFCTIYAPQDGMVVYYVEESRRGSEEGQIAPGMEVHDGQKFMQLPDLSQMQVSLKVHESVVMNLRPDVYSDTGFSEGIAELQHGLKADFLTLLAHAPAHRSVLDHLEEKFREQDQEKIADGQPATIRIDAMSGVVLHGHVKSVATVASQEWFAPEVKAFPTVVAIDDTVKGVRPNMSAEVSIHTADAVTDVLTLPIPAVVGGPEMGDVRKCYVMAEDGPKERTIRIGRSNQHAVEILEGVREGERVVLNPSLLAGPDEKTRDNLPTQGKQGKGGPGKSFKGGNFKGGGGGWKGK